MKSTRRLGSCFRFCILVGVTILVRSLLQVVLLSDYGRSYAVYRHHLIRFFLHRNDWWFYLRGFELWRIQLRVQFSSGVGLVVLRIGSPRFIWNLFFLANNLGNSNKHILEYKEILRVAREAG